MTFETLLARCSPALRRELRSSKDAVLVADDDGRYISANRRACALLGAPLESIVGRGIADFLAPGFDFEAAWKRFERDGLQAGDVPLRRPDGTRHVVHFRALRDIWPGHHVSVLWEGETRRNPRASRGAPGRRRSSIETGSPRSS